MDKKKDALKVLEEVLQELESKKVSISTAVQKLSRASELIDENEIYAWTQVQLGNQKFIEPLKSFFDAINLRKEQEKEGLDTGSVTEYFKEHVDKLEEINISSKKRELIEELYNQKMNISSGGFQPVSFIEQKLAIIIKEKSGNDKTYYQTNLQEHIAYIQKYTHRYTAELINKLKYAGTVESSFDVLKNAVDDKLLDLNPELAEQLMIAFKSASSDNEEELSQALTTCRRLLESLADSLYPATDEVINKRTFKQNQYINRIWQFMDVAIESKSNKAVAKTHVDFIGSCLQKDYALTCKGVHAKVSKLEATKTVFHIYLLLADILDYLDGSSTVKNEKISINKATMDELEAVLNINRNTAKLIVKARIQNQSLSVEQLAEIKGIGAKTLDVAQENFSFD